MSTSREQNGGYYAIKGFTYQFDKSLLEILNNQTQDVELEQIQDIGLNNFYIQVKYKETQNYADSKIKPAVLQLLKCFLDNKNKKFRLYCYFKDRSSQIITLTETQLDQILSSDSGQYTQDDKKAFIDNFTLEFSSNFEKQFSDLIKLIKTSFQLKSEEEATTYHAIFKANLFDVAIKKNPKLRTINFTKLKGVINSKEKIIFDVAYCKYLKTERYLKFIKKEYFTFKKLNIPNKERLFVVEADSQTKDGDIIQIVTNIKNKYFKKDTSPAPYICLFGVDNDKIIGLKQKLWDKGLIFSDGTHFNGDKFRTDDLVADTHNSNCGITFKLLSLDQLPSLFKKKRPDEAFVFLTSGDGEWRTKIKEFKEFYIGRTKNIIKIIQ
jgi:hypothetical protein